MKEMHIYDLVTFLFEFLAFNANKQIKEISI